MRIDKGASEARRERERLHLTLKAAGICMFEVDLRRQMYTVFENAEDIFGVSGETVLREVQPFSRLSPEEYLHAVVGYFFHPEDRIDIDKGLRAILGGEAAAVEARMRVGGSDYVWCKVNVLPAVENGKPVKIIGVITDISVVRERTDSLKRQARTDSFTGLYNKKYATRKIKQILLEDNERQHALVLLDIDGFKAVNDTYGHAVGDSIIADVARRLKGCFRETDIVSRFGGDEFLVLVRDVPEQGWLKDRLDLLTTGSALACAYTNSIGVALFPGDGQDFDSLFDRADRALYLAKDRRETYAFAEEGDGSAALAGMAETITD